MQRLRFLFLTALTATLASQAAALPQASTGGARATVRTRCTNCSSVRDSATRALHERLLLELDSLRWQYENVHLTDAERTRVGREMARTVLVLESSLDQSMRADAAVAAGVAVQATTVEPLRAAPAAVAVMTRSPGGYLGITFDGPSAECETCKERIIRFYQYPKIAMVETASPAARAGILEGDTLLAFNGTDVKNNEISLTKLLIPDSRIVVRIRREGDAKDLRVTVGEAPEYYVARAAPLPSRAPGGPVPARAPEQVRVPGEPMPPMIVTPRARPGTMWIFNNGVAGAQVATVSDGLGKAVGVKEGVLVIRAEPGTPAFRSGLRDGDVILRADGRTVATVNALRQAVAEGSGNEGVKLRILREKKQRDVTLRW